MIYNLYKQRGETPLECIQRFAKSKLGLKGEKMTYLGRLDPMAEGVLLMASGEDVQRKEEFLSLDKEYDFVSIFGFSTDTYDILGRIMRVEKIAEDPISLENQIRRVVSVYEGEREQKYPLYSSKGLALKKQNNSLAEDELPSKKITIHKINFHGLDALSNQELFGRLLMDISKVSGDFRQHEILVLWKEILLGSGSSHFNKKEISEKFYPLGKFSAHVSSGTYIRGLVNDLGNTLGCGATTLSIRRTRVGNYKIEDSLR